MAYKPGRRRRATGTSALAFVSLAVAIIGLLLIPLAIFHLIPDKDGFLVAPAEILAVIIGHTARHVGWTGEVGDGVALVGMIIGYGFFILAIVLLFAAFVFPGWTGPDYSRSG